MFRQVLASLAVGLCTLAAHAASPQVQLKTNLGEIVLELNEDQAPETTKNFLRYVKDGHYDGTIFHRVIPNFMIQGGGLDEALTEKRTRAPIKNEAANGLKNEVGTIAMARTSAPHSASSQFFINVSNNSFLDYPSQDGWGYCVFGKVIKGMEVVRKIEARPTRNQGMHQNVPVDPVVIESASVLEAPAHAAPAQPAAKPAASAPAPAKGAAPSNNKPAKRRER